MQIADAYRTGAGPRHGAGAAAPARRPARWRRRCVTPCFPAAIASGRSFASPSRRPAATPIRTPTRPRRRSSCCIAPRSSTTTCPVSTIAALRRGKPSVHVEYRRAARRADRRRADRARLRDARRGRGARPQRAWRRCSRIVARIGRHRPAASSPGQAWECEVAVPLADYQRAKTGALFAAATHGRRRRGRRRRASPGACSARSSAKPIRSPTICATCSATPTNSASRSARTPCACAPTRPRNSASAAPRRASRSWSRRRSSPFPIVPGAAELRALIKAQTALFFPKQLARDAA